jgi:hypothetical protein
MVGSVEGGLGLGGLWRGRCLDSGVLLMWKFGWCVLRLVMIWCSVKVWVGGKMHCVETTMAHLEKKTGMSNFCDGSEGIGREDVQCSKWLRCEIAFEYEHVVVNNVLLG